MPAALSKGRQMQMRFLTIFRGFAALGGILLLGAGCVSDGVVVSEFCEVYDPFPWHIYNGQVYQSEVFDYVDNNEIAYNVICRNDE